MARQELKAVITADATRFTRTMMRIRRTVSRVAMGLAGVAISGGILSVRRVAKFNKAMAEANTIANLGKSDFAKLGKEVRGLAVQFGASTDELTGGLYQALSAGVPADNSIEFLAVASRAATAGVTDVKTSVDGLTTAMNAYGIETGEAGRVADVFFQTVKLGKTTFGELSSNIGKVATIASKVGVEFEEMMTSIGQLTLGGLSTEMSITAMKSALQQLLKPSAAMIERFKEMGVANGQALIKQVGFAKAIKSIIGPYEDNIDVVTKLFPAIEGLTQILALAGDGADKFAVALDATKNSAGATNAAFAIMSETLAFQFDIAKAKINELMLKIGEELLPVVTSLVNTFTKLFEDKDTVDGLVIAFRSFGDAVNYTAQALSWVLRMLGKINVLSGAIGLIQDFWFRNKTAENEKQIFHPTSIKGARVQRAFQAERGKRLDADWARNMGTGSTPWSGDRATAYSDTYLREIKLILEGRLPAADVVTK